VALASAAEIITWFVFSHRSSMLSMVWLQADIDRYFLHWFPTAGWLVIPFRDNCFFLTGLALIIFDGHAVHLMIHIASSYLKVSFSQNQKVFRA
jgi:hypothetical protein